MTLPTPSLALILAACSGPAPLELGPQSDDTAPVSTESGLDDTGQVVAPLCGPQVRVEEGMPVEGDTVTMQLSCSTQAEPQDYEVELVSRVDGGDFNADDWQLRWDTDLDDAGLAEFLFVLRHRGSPNPQPETATGSLWVSDAGPGVSGNDPVDPSTYRYEFGLPVIHVDPQGSLSQEYTEAELFYQGVEYDAEIKIRGAASSNYPKNSFTLKFPDDHLDAEDIGFPDHDRLVLVTSFDDNAYVRQKLIYDVWKAMADRSQLQRLTPHTAFVVLYLDGEYFGLYTAIDHVDDRWVEQMGLSREGNLYKAVNHDANFYLTDSGGRAKGNLAAGYEKKEGEPLSGDGAFDDLQQLVNFTGGSDASTFQASSGQWLRADEFIDWLLLVQYTRSGDSAGKNAYLYNDPSTGMDFRYVPWDFNHALGQDWRTIRTGAGVLDDYRSRNRVFAHIQDNPQLREALYARAQDLMEPGAPLALDTWQNWIGEYTARIEPSARRDWALWEDTYRSYWSGVRGGTMTNYDSEMAYLDTWVQDHLAAMAANYDSEP